MKDAGCECERAVVMAACGVAIATLVPVALHQLGVVKHLPDPPGGLFDSDGITESKMAHPLGVPDALPGIASYGSTFVLASMAGRCEIARRALGAKLVVDAGAAGFNAVRQVVRFGKVCSWCMGTVAATAVMVWTGRRFVTGIARR